MIHFKGETLSFMYDKLWSMLLKDPTVTLSEAYSFKLYSL